MKKADKKIWKNTGKYTRKRFYFRENFEIFTEHFCHNSSNCCTKNINHNKNIRIGHNSLFERINPLIKNIM